MEAGKRVLHEKHGEGTVVTVRNNYATVQFDRGYTYDYDISEGVNPLKAIGRALTGQGSGLIPKSKKAKRALGAKYLDKVNADDKVHRAATDAEYKKIMKMPLNTPAEKMSYLQRTLARSDKVFAQNKKRSHRTARAIDLKYKAE